MRTYRGRKHSLESAKALAEKFVEELEEELKIDVIWWYVGSIKEKRYVAGKSDIDLVIIPKEKGMFSAFAIKKILSKIEKYKKYGEVFKKKRFISLIDVVIFFDLDMVNKLREDYYKK